MSDYLVRGEARPQAWSGFWWPMRESSSGMNIYDRGGPLDKYDQYCVRCGLSDPHAQDFERWQNWSDGREEAATGQNTYWWGHCNGWAAAAALEPEPARAHEISGIRFGVGDQKGLLTVCHNADSNDIIRSLGTDDAHVMHKLILASIGRQGRTLNFDTHGAGEVWNYPAYAYECEYQPAGDSAWDVTLRLWFASDGVPPDFVGTANWPVNGEPKVYTYRIRGSQGDPTSGSFTGSSLGDHPKLVWRPQPLVVQNAGDTPFPFSQTRFHPVRRDIVYSILAGQLHQPTPQDVQAYKELDLQWVVTPEEAAAYPPPLNAGDWWRYSVTHLDSGGRWSQPFLVQVEVVGWVGEDKQTWVLEVGTLEQGGQAHLRHVVYIDAETRTLSARAPHDNGYVYTLTRDPAQGGFTRSEEPALWESSPLRLLISQAPYAWERAGMEPVEPFTFSALSNNPLAVRSLAVGKGEQLWADYTVSNPRGNLRGFWLLARLDKISAQIIDFGHKEP